MPHFPHLHLTCLVRGARQLHELLLFTSAAGAGDWFADASDLLARPPNLQLLDGATLGLRLAASVSCMLHFTSRGNYYLLLLGVAFCGSAARPMRAGADPGAKSGKRWPSYLSDDEDDDFKQSRFDKGDSVTARVSSFASAGGPSAAASPPARCSLLLH
jgi:hypothetical protein